MSRHGRWLIDWPTVAGALLFILVGGGFCALGGYHLYRTAHFLHDADRVVAVVIDQEISHGSDSTSYRPTVRYTDRTGAARTARTELESSSYGFSVGSEVEVYANPAIPDVVRMGGFTNLWLFGLGFFLLGGIFPPLGLWILVSMGIRRLRS